MEVAVFGVQVKKCNLKLGLPSLQEKDENTHWFATYYLPPLKVIALCDMKPSY